MWGFIRHRFLGGELRARKNEILQDVFPRAVSGQETERAREMWKEDLLSVFLSGLPTLLFTSAAAPRNLSSPECLRPSSWSSEKNMRDITVLLLLLYCHLTWLDDCRHEPRTRGKKEE